MSETYLSIMLQSLCKKEAVLDEIIRLNDLQKVQLTDSQSPVQDFDDTVERKSACIGQLEQLDSGFEKLYAQVAEELQTEKEKYADTIRELQKHIRSVTDKSVKIQAQEARNKDLMMQKFATVRQQAKDVRANSKAINGYYRTMTYPGYMDSQFMDGKK
ncbi:MAG: flagellar export chaperone FlgN [Agathobacter sp.]|nr:flagellar export chaperone FlgN [Agathobacter sp.]